MFPCLPYLAYIALDLNPASWAALVAQLAEHWTSNPVVMGSNPVRGSSVFFSLSAFGLCLTLSCLPLHIHVQDLIMYVFVHTYSDLQHILHEEECSDPKEGWKFVSRSEYTEVWRKADPTKPVHLIKVWDGGME